MGNEDFTALEAAMARDWLDKLVKLRSMQNECCRLNDKVKAQPPSDSGIYLYHGADYITGLLCLEMEEHLLGENRQFPYEYSFMYGGVRFYQLSDKRLTLAGKKRI